MKTTYSVCAFCIVSIAAAASAVDVGAFRNPGVECRPETWFHLIGGNVSKEGMDADLILVDFSAPHLMPCHNVLNALVYSAKGGDVAMTMVRGKILYQNGQFPTIDLKSVVEELTTYAIPRVFAEDRD